MFKFQRLFFFNTYIKKWDFSVPETERTWAQSFSSSINFTLFPPTNREAVAWQKVTFLPLRQRGLTHQCYNKTVTLLVAHVVTCMRVDCVFNTYLGKASKQ